MVIPRVFAPVMLYHYKVAGMPVFYAWTACIRTVTDIHNNALGRGKHRCSFIDYKINCVFQLSDVGRGCSPVYFRESLLWNRQNVSIGRSHTVSCCNTLIKEYCEKFQIQTLYKEQEIIDHPVK